MRGWTRQLQASVPVLDHDHSERTPELIETNVDRKQDYAGPDDVEAMRARQLRIQQALAGCSQDLLLAAEDEDSQRQALSYALEHLLSGAQASRAHLLRAYDDVELGLCIGLVAEASAAGVSRHIDNPVNQRLPVSLLPPEMVTALTAGRPFGGPVGRTFASAPHLQKEFLSQREPLRSVQFFPIHDRGRWWGCVGLDDCLTEREWDAIEISMLRIASAMIGNTLQRWQTAAQLRQLVGLLDTRVEKRTAELSEANLKLNEEVQQRQRAQDDLEKRLRTEAILASISARLLEPTNIRANIAASLEDLAHLLDAGRAFLVEYDPQSENRPREFFEWHRPEAPPLSMEVIQRSIAGLPRLGERLRDGETVYLADSAQCSSDDEMHRRFLQESGVHSLALSPIAVNQTARAVLGCSNFQASADTLQVNLRSLQWVAHMLQSLLQREYLVQNLEQQMAKRTRQLTTFLDMAMASGETQDLADLLRPTLLPITQLAMCDATSIHVIHEQNSSLELIGQRGIPPEFLSPLREIHINAEFAAGLAEAEPHEVFGNVADSQVLPEAFHIPGFGAFFATRLTSGSRQLGLLSCYRVEHQPFSPFQATLLTALGDLLGIIVENQRLRIEAREVAAVGERQRLAREIHDAISQSVYSLSLFAHSAKDALEDGNHSRLLSDLQDIEEVALQAVREMRLLLYELWETDAADDIATALDARYQQVENRLGIQASREIDVDVLLPDQVRYEVWRIISEALNNVVKHARAAHVHVRVACVDENLDVSVRDDGVGFDARERPRGMGLANIRVRVAQLGGNLNILSTPGRGTQVNFQVPIVYIDPD